MRLRVLKTSLGQLIRRRFAFAGVINKEYSANKIFSIIEKTTRVRFNVNGRVVTVSEINNKQE